jgi:hypothetical protein
MIIWQFPGRFFIAFLIITTKDLPIQKSFSGRKLQTHQVPSPGETTRQRRQYFQLQENENAISENSDM